MVTLIVKRLVLKTLTCILNKAFGPNFELSEEYLTSDIKSEIIINALKKRYGFKKVTKATMKHILYEGARISRVLRINDSSYERMIDILDIDLEKESDNDGIKEEDEEEKENNNSSTSIEVK